MLCCTWSVRLVMPPRSTLLRGRQQLLLDAHEPPLSRLHVLIDGVPNGVDVYFHGLSLRGELKHCLLEHLHPFGLCAGKEGGGRQRLVSEGGYIGCARVLTLAAL